MRTALTAWRAVSRSGWRVGAAVVLFFATAAGTALWCLAGAFGALTGAFSVPLEAVQVLLRTAVFAAAVFVLSLARRRR